jgi:[ribosomal protein S18]-alanine N-acetyltransferase
MVLPKPKDSSKDSSKDPSVVCQQNLSTTGILSRPMRPEDLPQVINIAHLSFSSPWSRSSFLQEFDNSFSRMLVVENNDQVTGYLCCWCVADEVHVLNVAVHPGYRRRGIARGLMEEILLEARKEKAKTVSLEVRKGNLAAVSLYHHLGFHQIGVRRRYYENGEDALLMVCFLKEDACL